MEASEERRAERGAASGWWGAKLADPAADGIGPSDQRVDADYEELKQQLRYEEHEWEKLSYELDLLQDQLRELL